MEEAVVSRKTVAVAVEIIPPVSALLSYLLIVSKYDSDLIRWVIAVTFLLAFLGIVFFFIGRLLAKESRLVRVLGIFDLLSTAFIVGFFALAIFVFAW